MSDRSTIPLIDCSAIAGDFAKICDKDFDAVTQKFGAAMTGVGMCNVINHGVDMKKIETIYEVSARFFELPMKTKLKYRKACPTKSNHGYACPGDQT